MLDGLSEVVGGSVPHLSDDKGSNLRWRVLLASRLHPCVTVGVGNNLEWNVGNVLLDLGILELSSDQSNCQLDLLAQQDGTYRLEAKMVFSPLTTACRRAG